MLIEYKHISPRRFNRVFTTLAPCECHTEDFDTMYDVKVVFDDKTSIANLLTVKCSSCGSIASFFVANYNKSERDVAFIGAKKVN